MMMLQRNVSKTRRIARRVGIDIESPAPHLPYTEQEAADIM